MLKNVLFTNLYYTKLLGRFYFNCERVLIVNKNKEEKNFADFIKNSQIFKN